MILEAFSEVLHRERQRTGQQALDILQRWLLSILSEAVPADNIERVIHAEIALADLTGQPVFLSKSGSGEILLKSLYTYCDSYEHWQFRRWLHNLNATAFERR